MQRLALTAFLLAVALSLAFVGLSAALLPDPLATHFGFDGRPNGWMPQRRYLTAWLALTGLLPGLIAGSIVLIARRAPRLVNIPHRGFWLDPARRAATVRWLGAAALWLGTVVACFLAALHGLIVLANRSLPPALPQRAFYATVGLFVLAVVVWTLAYYARFRLRRGGPGADAGRGPVR